MGGRDEGGGGGDEGGGVAASKREKRKKKKEEGEEEKERRKRERRGKRRRKREKRKKKKKEGEEEKERRKQAACSLLRNLRLPGGAGGRLSETELYRIWDVATSWYHATQTANVPAGSLVFVRQGVHGALSMMIVGGRSAACPDEFTILIRGC